MLRRVICAGGWRGEIARVAVLLAFVLALALSDGKAQNALSADVLLGRWCGEITAYSFTRDRLTVTFFNGSPQRILRIKTVNVGDGWIEVVWDPRDGNNTVFEEFTSNSMVQAPNTTGDMGPRREFRRC
jgi:hypothetical protein